MALEKLFNVEIRIRAKEEVDEISFNHEKFSSSLKEKFYKKLKESSKILADNPFFHKNYNIVRRLFLKSFPFSVHFRIDEKNFYRRTVISDHLLFFSKKIKL